MIFKGFQKTSLIEYPGKIASIVWVAGCNFRCPFCYNLDLVLNPEKLDSITEEEVINHLKENKKWIDALAITGGEPTLHEDLPDFIKKVKELNLLVEIETNGTNPAMLDYLIKNKLVDYIAFDIKAPLIFEEYKKATRIINKKLFENIKKSISLVMNSNIDYEFRITVVPKLHNKEKLIQIAKQLKGIKRFCLQQFKNDVPLMENSFKNVKPYSKKELEEFYNEIKDYFKECKLKA